MSVLFQGTCSPLLTPVLECVSAVLNGLVDLAKKVIDAVCCIFSSQPSTGTEQQVRVTGVLSPQTASAPIPVSGEADLSSSLPESSASAGSESVENSQNLNSIYRIGNCGIGFSDPNHVSFGLLKIVLNWLHQWSEDSAMPSDLAQIVGKSAKDLSDCVIPNDLPICDIDIHPLIKQNSVKTSFGKPNIAATLNDENCDGIIMKNSRDAAVIVKLRNRQYALLSFSFEGNENGKASYIPIIGVQTAFPQLILDRFYGDDFQAFHSNKVL